MATLSKCCDERAVHNHGNQAYFAGRSYGWKVAFEWRRPKVTAYRAATSRRIAFHLNRYPGVVIGADVQVGARVVSLTWGAPGRIVDSEASR